MSSLLNEGVTKLLQLEAAGGFRVISIGAFGGLVVR